VLNLYYNTHSVFSIYIYIVIQFPVSACISR